MRTNKLNNKKILYLVKTLDVGGAERFTFNLCKYFVNVFAEVTVFSSGGIFEEELKKLGVKTTNSTLAYRTRIKNYFKLKNELKLLLSKNHFDIIHCQHRYFVPIIKSLKSKNTSLVYTANNYFNDLYQRFLFPDVAVAISSTIYKNLISTLSIKSNRIIQINYGVEENTLKKVSSVIHIGFVGRLIKEKGIYDLVEAAKILISHNIRFRLLIKGTGPEKDKISKIISDPLLNSFIQIDNIDTNIEKIYNNLDIIVLPSKLNEGLPVSILESLVNKILVVTTSVGGVQDVIRNNETGFILKSNNPSEISEILIYIVNNFNSLENIKETGYKLVCRKYSLSKMLNGYEELYLNIFNSF